MDQPRGVVEDIIRGHVLDLVKNDWYSHTITNPGEVNDKEIIKPILTILQYCGVLNNLSSTTPITITNLRYSTSDIQGCLLEVLKHFGWPPQSTR